MEIKNIRNFSIIAHIDHGKSTLADRMLELTNTIEKRKMRDQVLDSMELERERGITIKMQPVSMRHKVGGVEYALNLIDTPGHIDFAYEVSRAIKAVEGSILLVDATQGVQAQTFSVLNMAKESGLVIIPAVSKIDSPLARVDDVKLEVAKLLDCNIEDILEVSGKTGDGVLELLEKVIEKIPPPKIEVNDGKLRSLVFDFQYSTHRGVIVYVRILAGSVEKNTALIFANSNEKFNALEVGIFSPEETPVAKLEPGMIGYIVTGIKKPGIASVGDTVTTFKNPAEPMSGYMKPKPVVWASIYPESQDDFNELKMALDRLKLSDSSLSFEEEHSTIIGRGFRCGLLGMLHLEIVSERLHREFNLDLIVTTPSITYKIRGRNGEEKMIYTPFSFPDDGNVSEILEPMVNVKIISPSQYMSGLMNLFYDHEAEIGDVENWGDNRSAISLVMPLRELMRNFFDELKSVSSGFASLSYEIGEFRVADVARLDILVAEEVVPAFSRVVSKKKIAEEAEKAVEKLYGILPRQMFVVKIQGKAMGRILSSKTLSAYRKDVTQHMYGGDITRRMKLWEKQKKGKKKMQALGKVDIPHDVFMKMMKTGEN